MPVKTIIKHRADSAANWISASPTLLSGEIGFETDTLKFKIGNGTDNWVALPYAKAGSADTATDATNASKITASSLNRTVFVQSGTPSGAVTGDIWIQTA